MSPLKSGPCGCSLQTYVLIIRYLFLALKIVLVALYMMVCYFARPEKPEHEIHEDYYSLASFYIYLQLVLAPFFCFVIIIPNIIGILAVKKKSMILLTLALIEAGISFIGFPLVAFYLTFLLCIYSSSYIGLLLLIYAFVGTAWYFYDFAAVYSLSNEYRKTDNIALI